MKIPQIVFVFLWISVASAAVQYPWDERTLTEDEETVMCSDMDCNLAVDNLYKGDCGFFFDENERWCYSELFTNQVCCAENADECCNAKIAVITGASLLLLGFLGIGLWACCVCFSCCPYHKRYRTIAWNEVDNSTEKGIDLTMASYEFSDRDLS